jgi:hypothetical protein
MAKMGDKGESQPNGMGPRAKPRIANRSRKIMLKKVRACGDGSLPFVVHFKALKHMSSRY